MNKKLLAITIIGIFMISFVSANILTDVWDFLTGKEKPIKKIPSYVKLGLNETTFNTFNEKVNSIKVLPICLKTPENSKCREKNPNYNPIDISYSNYFDKNELNVQRFKNG